MNTHNKSGPESTSVTPTITPRGVKKGSQFYDLFVRVLNRQKTNGQEAIMAFCLDCQGLDAKGVETCGDRKCFLWNYGPFQSAEGKDSTSSIKIVSSANGSYKPLDFTESPETKKTGEKTKVV